MDWSKRIESSQRGEFTFGSEAPLTTIRLGSTGDDVKKWQGIIGVTADGIFGPATEAATKLYQQKYKLAADGVVGPQTWAKALGTTAPIAKTANAPADTTAYQIAKSALPNEPEGQIQYAVTVARGEGGYGNSWTGDGVGSNNWGAVQGSGDAGSFQHIDHHADGSQYTTAFKKYSTPQAGFTDMYRILFNGGTKGAAGATAIKAALKKGNLHDAVYAQHNNGYFELAPDAYLTAVLGNYNTLAVNVDGWKRILSATGTSILRTILGFVGLAIGAGLWYGYGKKQMSTVEEDSSFWLATDNQDLSAINDYMHAQTLNNAEATALFNDWVSWYEGLGFMDLHVDDGTTYDTARNKRNAFNLANATSDDERTQVQNVITQGQSSEQDAGQTDRRDSSGSLPGAPLIPTYVKIIIGIGVFVGAMVGINAASNAAVVAGLKKL